MIDSITARQQLQASIDADIDARISEHQARIARLKAGPPASTQPLVMLAHGDSWFDYPLTGNGLRSDIGRCGQSPASSRYNAPASPALRACFSTSASRRRREMAASAVTWSLPASFGMSNRNTRSTGCSSIA